MNASFGLKLPPPPNQGAMLLPQVPHSSTIAQSRQFPSSRHRSLRKKHGRSCGQHRRLRRLVILESTFSGRGEINELTIQFQISIYDCELDMGKASLDSNCFLDHIEDRIANPLLALQS
jgi:hypothetical protein